MKAIFIYDGFNDLYNLTSHFLQQTKINYKKDLYIY